MLDKDNKDYKRFRKEAIEHIKRHNADALAIYYNPEDKPLMNEYVYLLEEDIKDVEISRFASPNVEKGKPLMTVKRSKEEDKFVYGRYLPHLKIDLKETVSDMFIKRLRNTYGIKETKNENS